MDLFFILARVSAIMYPLKICVKDFPVSQRSQIEHIFVCFMLRRQRNWREHWGKEGQKRGGRKKIIMDIKEWTMEKD